MWCDVAKQVKQVSGVGAAVESRAAAETLKPAVYLSVFVCVFVCVLFPATGASQARAARADLLPLPPHLPCKLPAESQAQPRKTRRTETKTHRRKRNASISS